MGFFELMAGWRKKRYSSIMWTQFSFLVTQLNCNYPKCRRGEKWKEWPKNGGAGLPGTLSTRHISPDLLRPDKRDSFLALDSAQRVADQLHPGVQRRMPARCLCHASKRPGRKKINMYTGCRPLKAAWCLCGAPCVFSWVHQGFIP